MNKKRWEDWIFSFFLRDEAWALVDLLWFKYSIIIEQLKTKIEVFTENGDITVSWQELVKTIPALTTKDFSTWTYQIEYKIENPTGNIFITDRVAFECISTLHYN